MLELRGVSKRFGGDVATDDVTLEIANGEVHALIGANGDDITQLTTHARVAAGLARSYQITSIFRRFTVLENLALAVQARSGSSFSFWRPVHREAALFDEARTIAAG